MAENYLWCEKYRPKTIADTILSPALKTTFQAMVSDGEVQNMIFTGSPGLGKTTVAKALCLELGCDFIMVNGSDEGRKLDEFYTKVKQFATSVSLVGQKKVVIVDEADYMNAQSVQPSLRGFIEQYSNNCRFIFTCNYKDKIIAPIHSRSAVYEFNISKKELPQLSKDIFLRLVDILTNENVSWDKKILIEYVKKYLPDWRRTINEVQRNSATGTLLPLATKDANAYGNLMQYLKEKEFNKMRKWVSQNMDVDSTTIYRSIYDQMSIYVTDASIPQLVLILADYSYKHSFVADSELNIVACMTDMMLVIDFK
jgi:DNA polymerase III delta prime subunit